jgi:peptidoglycan/LPS O-acetylase OafA/YrhL
MTSYISEKFKILSAISILLVLYIHSGFHTYEIDGMTLNNYTQQMISSMIGRCAVPLFYIISGYLFFYKVPNGMYSILEKMKKRVRTLVIPYVIGCCFFVVFATLVTIIPGTNQFMNNSILPLFEQNWKTVLISIFYVAEQGAPMAFQLWFLRNLIILITFSPLWYLLLKYLKWSWVVIVFVLNYFPVLSTCSPLRSLFWFSLGGLLVSYHLSGKYKRNLSSSVLFLIFLILCMLQLFHPDFLLWKYAEIPIILLGVVSIWLLYDLIVPQSFSLQSHSWLVKICNFTFFIYLFHEPALNIVRKLIVFILGKNEIGYLFSYLISPWIFIFLIVIIGLGLKKYLPKIYRVSCGGR